MITTSAEACASPGAPFDHVAVTWLARFCRLPGHGNGRSAGTVSETDSAKLSPSASPRRPAPASAVKSTPIRQSVVTRFGAPSPSTPQPCCTISCGTPGCGALTPVIAKPSRSAGNATRSCADSQNAASKHATTAS